jgi:hypothetical protein
MTKSDLELVDLRSYRTIDDLGPEERKKALVEFYTARRCSIWRRNGWPRRG